MAEKTAEVKNDKPAEKKVVVEIVRGQMPAPIVNMIKTSDAALTDGALAAKFRTTNGKVSDIRKNRNFGYINETYVPTTEELEKAKAWAEKHGGKEIIEAVAALKPGSEDARKKYEESKVAFRAAAKAAKGDAAKPAAKPAEKPAEGDAPVKPAAKVSDKDMKDLTA